jgi:uncharacterized protein YhbP (UPF0306 family)
MSLATVSTTGEPHAAAVYFVSDQALQLYFFSDPDSQHGRDVAQNPRAAVSIFPECEGWQDIRGVQMRGQVHGVMPGDQWERAWQRYLDKFPFVKELKAVVAQNALYVFSPHWIRLIDNRRGFGFKEEWTLPSQ